MNLLGSDVDARFLLQDPQAGLARSEAFAQSALPPTVGPGHDVVPVRVGAVSNSRRTTSDLAAPRPRISRAALELEGCTQRDPREDFRHVGLVLLRNVLEAICLHRGLREALGVAVRLAVASPPTEGLLALILGRAPRPVGRHLARRGQRAVIPLKPPCLSPEIGVRVA
jgi:hypothetical protein